MAHRRTNTGDRHPADTRPHADEPAVGVCLSCRLLIDGYEVPSAQGLAIIAYRCCVSLHCLERRVHLTNTQGRSISLHPLSVVRQVNNQLTYLLRGD